MKKALFVLLLGFIVRLFFSCCNCPDDVTAINLNSMYISNLDNSDIYFNGDNPVFNDSMINAAVAFEVAIIDSTIKEYPVYYGANIGFNSASAMEPCACFPYYEAEEEITSFTITTLNDINSKYKAGSDVTSLFVGTPSENFLYKNFSDIIQVVNEQIQHGFPGIKIGVFKFPTLENNGSLDFYDFYQSDAHDPFNSSYRYMYEYLGFEYFRAWNERFSSDLKMTMRSDFSFNTLLRAEISRFHQ